MDSDTENKRISPHCSKVASNIVNTKRIIAIILILFMLIPLLYLIPCSITNIKLTIPTDCTISSFTVLSTETNQSDYQNVTINNDHFAWTVRSIDVYLNSYSSDINDTELLQYVIYGKRTAIDNRLNTLQIRLYDSSAYRQIGIDCYYISLNDFYQYYECPVDYVLSYFKITIESVPELEDSHFTVAFYGFLQSNPRNELKYGVISELMLLNLTYNADTYSDWYNWNANHADIPETYPYLILYELRRYNFVTEQFGVYSI